MHLLRPRAASRNMPNAGRTRASIEVQMTSKPTSLAIIGGGPGGLFTAYRLQQRCALPFTTTIYEASPRVGGKILTAEFSAVPARYEAGAAELYDYSHVGDDPLRRLVAELRLDTRPMEGSAVIMDDRVIGGLDDACHHVGEPAWRVLRQFDTAAKAWMTPREFYDADWADRAQDPKTTESFHALLERVPNDLARRYLQCLVHSDLATEPHQTNASYGLQNYLMNDPGYLRLYTIDGGIERLPRTIASRLSANIRVNEPVIAVGPGENGALRVESRRHGDVVSEQYDYVVAALPNDWLPAIEWRG